MARSLDQLLNTRTDLWRGRQGRAIDTVPSGRAALDACLPGGGWPCGKLIDLVPERIGSGEFELLLPVLAALTRNSQPVALVAPPLVPCPQALASAGLDLTRLLVIREPRHAFWSAEQCLKSGLVGALVVWPPAGTKQERPIRRLQLAAERGSAPVFLCHAPGDHPPPSLSMLRLAVRTGGEIEILRNRLSGKGGRLRLRGGNVVPMRSKASSDAHP